MKIFGIGTTKFDTEKSLKVTENTTENDNKSLKRVQTWGGEYNMWVTERARQRKWEKKMETVGSGEEEEETCEIKEA